MELLGQWVRHALWVALLVGLHPSAMPRTTNRIVILRRALLAAAPSCLVSKEGASRWSVCKGEGKGGVSAAHPGSSAPCPAPGCSCFLCCPAIESRCSCTSLLGSWSEQKRALPCAALPAARRTAQCSMGAINAAVGEGRGRQRSTHREAQKRFFRQMKCWHCPATHGSAAAIVSARIPVPTKATLTVRWRAAHMPGESLRSSGLREPLRGGGRTLCVALRARVCLNVLAGRAAAVRLHKLRGPCLMRGSHRRQRASARLILGSLGARSLGGGAALHRQRYSSARSPQRRPALLSSGRGLRLPQGVLSLRLADSREAGSSCVPPAALSSLTSRASRREATRLEPAATNECRVPRLKPAVSSRILGGSDLRAV